MIDVRIRVGALVLGLGWSLGCGSSSATATQDAAAPAEAGDALGDSGHRDAAANADDGSFDAGDPAISDAGRRLLWVHNIPVWTYSTYETSEVLAYGSSYPLALGDAGDGLAAATLAIRNAMAAGIDGFAIDTQPSIAQVTAFLEAADMVNSDDAGDAGDAGAHFLIAPTIDLGGGVSCGDAGTSDSLRYLCIVDSYCTIAKMSKYSAAKVGIQYVMFTYSDLDVADWNNTRSQFKCDGEPIYWVGNVPFDYVNGAPSNALISSETRDAAAMYDFNAYYGFEDISVSAGTWESIAAPLAEAGIPFLGGMYPGYYRGVGVTWMDGGAGGPFDEGVNMAASGHYRAGWANVLDSGIAWTHIATWNDFTEHTTLEPDSDLSTLRRDLTAWYAASFKNSKFTLFETPQLYITTPEALYLTQSGVAEALVINPSATPLTVSISMPGSTTVAAAVAPHSVGAATLPVDATAPVAGSYLVATATVDTSPVQTVTSAPILIYPSPLPMETGSTVSAIHTAPQYYSIPARFALGEAPELALVGGSLVITPHGVSPRFLDLLCDTNRVGPIGTSLITSYSTATLAVNASASTNDNYYEIHYGTSFGLCVAREIDADNSVGYSIPVLVNSLKKGEYGIRPISRSFE